MVLHVIDNKLQKEKIPANQFEKFNRRDSKDKRHLDIDWYLSNGFITLDEFNRRLDVVIDEIYLPLLVKKA